ncbi:MAG: leucine--tRNA ligase [Flavobacteriales bacterium]|jgi:leucyl-tRNA synthetase|nr:leucine--tRNA ligase [Flavobacteriales bacterium]MBT5090642.1 leucine--tRNA ligase [Flavobacteriales bacterium]MBT5749857.1 leucine--tRNA ligase [Flavobacteriales bacterium]
MDYNFNKLEKKWQSYWRENETYKVSEDTSKHKYYVLDMFPYPSGAGLHVGHPLGYIASDVYARYKKLKGFNVLHPMGYDSFGLPTEQYAIQTGIHPAVATKDNTQRYRKQLDQIGFSFDWSREVQTSDPNYYKWTQWIFKQLFNSCYCNSNDKAMPITDLVAYFEKKGNHNSQAFCDDNTPKFSSQEWRNFTEKEKEKMLLNYRLAFLSDTWVNWCEGLGTVLANDEVKDGLSERGGFSVEQKLMKQWSLRITAYADRLISGLDTVDWSDSIKDIQKNWIGKSKGVSVIFKLENSENKIEVFTTRPDTIFGVNFMVLAPEHELVSIITTAEQIDEVETYVKTAKLKSERDRQSDNSVSGVFTGAYAIHPFTGNKIQIWIGDYVLVSYGTGAVMAVPCGDQRDWNFANHFGLEIINIFEGIDVTERANKDKNVKISNSDFLNNLTVKKAMNLAIFKIEEGGFGKGKINYRLRDAIFSRQRYWGEPFPVYYKNETAYILNDNKQVTLPVIDKYLPTASGESPLARAKKEDWSVFEGDRMETNIMPGWAGSSWYFLRYMDPNNDGEFCAKEKSDYWGQVDLYIGGAEHAVGHLLYSRFWTKFLFDRGFISFDEPFKKMINQGMILGRSSFVYRINDTNTFVSFDKRKEHKTTRLHTDISFVDNDVLDVEAFKNWSEEYSNAEFVLNEDGKYLCGHEVEKMSKSKYNVQTPDNLVEDFGADTLRLYEMFLGPLEQFKPWDVKGISGVHNFLRKFWRLVHDTENNFSVSEEKPTKDNYKTLHKTIKKVEEEIERYSFNTVVSTFMICINELTEQKCSNRAIITDFTILLSSYAPHIAEEIWSKLGNETSVTKANFPTFNASYLVENEVNYPVSFNGKMRFKIALPTEITKEQVEIEVMQHEKTAHYLEGKSPKKIIVVLKRIVNIVM